MNQQGDKEGKDWHKDHSHGGPSMGWGGLLNETNRQSIETMKQWNGAKAASVRSIPNKD